MGSPNDSGRSLFVDSCSSCELAAARKLEHFHTAAERQQATGDSCIDLPLDFIVHGV